MSAKRKFDKVSVRFNSGKPLLELIQHKYGSLHSSQRVPSARPDNIYLNRNITCAYPNKLYNNISANQRNLYYDLSESDTAPDTPDIRSEESDSSTGSVLSRADAAAAKILADEWACIERTLYDEEGDKVTRSQLVEECKQWKELVPHLRIIGKCLQLPEYRLSYEKITEEEEIFAIHNDKNASSDSECDSEERLTDSSESDCTPCNSPRSSFSNKTLQTINIKQDSFTSEDEDSTLSKTFNSFLQVKHINPSSARSRNTYRQRNVSSILKSEISSSKWRRNESPESTVLPRRVVNNCGSAKSFVSLEPRSSYLSSSSTTAKINASSLNRVSTANSNRILTASLNRFSTGNLNRVSTASLSRVSTARQSEKLQPIKASQTVIYPLYCSPYVKSSTKSYEVPKNNRKVSLPPIDIGEEKGKMHYPKSAASSRIRNNNKKPKSSLIPLIINKRGTFDINENY